MTTVAAQYSAVGQFFPARPLVLMSEINDDTRSMLRVVLEMWGFEVIEAGTSEDTRIIAEHEHPSLILMDTTYPYDDTLRSLHSLQKLNLAENVPVILLSGYVGTAYRTAAFENGASGFLVKPVDLGFLENYCKSIVAGRSSTKNTKAPTNQ